MPVLLIVTVWTGVTLYALLGGADFGAGILHLLVRGPAAERQRHAIAAAIGPLWEANHVWLIFAITGLFSAFPRAFDALGTLAFAPATLAVIAIALRGAAFAFAASAGGADGPTVLFRRIFGVASVAAPFLFGTIAGGLARGSSANSSGFWIGPFQLVVGALAVSVCAALAASYLTLECRRARDRELAEHFRSWALWWLGATALLAAVALALTSTTAPRLFHGLTHRALPEVLLGFLALAGAHAALGRRLYEVARAALAFGIGAVLWGWAFAQYPQLVGANTVANSAASPPELTAVAIALGAGLLLLTPALWLLYVAFRRQPAEVQR